MRIHAIFGGIGAFAVKFRWVVIAAWLIAGFAVPKFLPSLSRTGAQPDGPSGPGGEGTERDTEPTAPYTR